MAISRKSTPKSAATKERVKKVIDRLSKTHPDAKLALNFSNPLELLIALILAAQTRDDLVNSITAELPAAGATRPSTPRPLDFHRQDAGAAGHDAAAAGDHSPHGHAA